MPSVRLELGEYVTVRGPARNDGTVRVFFEVPANRRPSGWSPTIPLPLLDRRGDLNDIDEVARIRRDAKALYAELQQARTGRPVLPPGRTLEALIVDWQLTEEYRDTKPRTKEGYEHVAQQIRDWSAAAHHPDPTLLTEKRVRQFLATYDDRPWAKWHMRKVLRLVMARAVALGWRQDNPVDGIKVKMPESQVTIWEAEDVTAYVAAAREVGQPSVAAIILTEWEIGQRLTDVVLYRHEADFRAAEGVFRFRQSKTGNYVSIPVSGALSGLIHEIRVDGSPYLFHDGATGRPFPGVNRLGHVFETVRERAVKNGARPGLVLRALRHSCVVQLARAGCTVPEIASITGHSISSVESILSTYLPRDNEVAWNAQAKRGLIER